MTPIAEVEPARNPEPSDRPADPAWRWTGRPEGKFGGVWNTTELEPYVSCSIGLREPGHYRAGLHTGGDGPSFDGPPRQTVAEALDDVADLRLLLRSFEDGLGERRHASRVRALDMTADLVLRELGDDLDHQLAQPDYPARELLEVADALRDLAKRMREAIPADALLWRWLSAGAEGARGPHAQ